MISGFGKNICLKENILTLPLGNNSEGVGATIARIVKVNENY